MKLKDIILLSFTIALLSACNSSKKIQVILPGAMKESVKIKPDTAKVAVPKQEIDNAKTSPFLENLLKQFPEYFDSILKYRKAKKRPNHLYVY